MQLLVWFGVWFWCRYLSLPQPRQARSYINFFVGKVDFPIEKDANAQKEQREDIFYLQRRLGDQCRVSQGDDVGNKGNKQQPEA